MNKQRKKKIKVESYIGLVLERRVCKELQKMWREKQSIIAFF